MPYKDSYTVATEAYVYAVQVGFLRPGKDYWRFMNKKLKREAAWVNCMDFAVPCTPQFKGRVITAFIKLVDECKAF